MTSGPTPSATSSPASASGATPCAPPVGPMIAPPGPAPAPASLSARQAKALGLLTSGTYGPPSSTSSAPSALSSFLASRLRRVTDLLGSTLFTLTWKERVTPRGGSIPALRASARRTSASACTGWPAPVKADGERGSTKYCGGNPTMLGAAQLAAWPTPIVNDELGSTHCYGPKRPDGTRDRFWKLPGAAALASWPTTRSSDADKGVRSPEGAAKERERRKNGADLNSVAQAVGHWPTPMAGTPAQKGYNEAGNTDSSRKTVALIDPASWATPTTRDHKDGDCSEQIATGGVQINALLGRQVLLAHAGGERGRSGQSRSQDAGHARVTSEAGPTNGHWADAEWLPCRDGKARPVEPGTFPLAHGAPARVGRLRAYGNALVAPQATEFCRAALDYCRLVELSE